MGYREPTVREGVVNTVLAGVFARTAYLTLPLRRLTEPGLCERILRESAPDSATLAAVMRSPSFRRRFSAYPDAPENPLVVVGRDSRRSHLAHGTLRLWSAPAPDGSLCEVNPTGVDGPLHIVSPDFYLLLRASELSRATLLLLLMEFWGLYDRREDCEGGMAPREFPLSTPRSLGQTFEGVNARFPGRARIAWAMERALANSFSPRESALAAFLSLPLKDGGMGLGPVELNRPIDLSPEGRAICGQSRAVPDIFFPEAQVDVEYDSRAFHGDPERSMRDKDRQLALEASGVEVLPVGPGAVATPEALLATALTVARAVNGRSASGESPRLLKKRWGLHGKLFGASEVW